jgi:autotransporter translocation and assembly factor TamB
MVLRVLIGFAVLVLITAGALWWLLSTETASRKAVAFLLGKSVKGVEIAEVHGSLRGPLLLLGIRYRSGGLSAEVDSALLDIRPYQLLKGKVVFERVEVSGMRVILPDSTPRDTAGTSHARREKPEPPLPVEVGEGIVRGFDLDGPRDMAIRGGTLRLAGNLDQYRFTMTGTVLLPRIDTTRIVMGGIGSLEAMRLDSTTTAEIGGSRVLAVGTLRWWPGIEWDLRLDVDSLSPSRWMTDPGLLPGTLNFQATTAGRIDTLGPVGVLAVDSMAGALRGQPVHGEAFFKFRNVEVEEANLDVWWGSARLRADGAVGETLGLKYDLAVQDLGTVNAGADGSLTAKGTASGPRRTPHIQAKVEGKHVGFVRNGAQAIRANADLNFATGGKLVLELRADSATIATRRYSRIDVTLRGTTRRHQLTASAVSPIDTVRLAAAGGVSGRSWRGQIDEVTVLSAVENWHLVEPTRLSYSPASARLERFCVAADSIGGQLCGEASWQNARSWNALATLDQVRLDRVPIQTKRGILQGLLGARVEAHNTGTGLVATVTAQVVDTSNGNRNSSSDSTRGSIASLDGRATLPGYWLGRSLIGQPMQTDLKAGIEDLAFVQPFFPVFDTLQGRARLELKGTGMVMAPRLETSGRLDSLMAHLRGHRRVTGSIELASDVTIDRNRTLKGDIHLVPHQMVLEYQHQKRPERFRVDSGGGVSLVAGDRGINTTFGFTFRTEAGDSLAGINGELVLPRYTRLGAPLWPQPILLRVGAELADLSVMRPVMLSLDSLSGTVALHVLATGTAEMPTITGILRVQNAAASLPSGTSMSGNLQGDLDVTVSRDSTIRGSLKLEPSNAKLAYPRYGGASEVLLKDVVLEAKAGPDGVRGTLRGALTGEGGTTLATLEGNGALPRYTRIGRPVGREPVEGRLEGKVDDFAFLPAFFGIVDSAAGQMNLDARLAGTVSESRLTGDAKIQNAALRMPGVGVLIQDINLTASGDQASDIAVNGTMKSGGGELKIEGKTPVRSSRAKPGKLTIRGDRFLAANNAEVKALVSPNLDVELAGDTLIVRGDVVLPFARIELAEIPELAIKPSDDVIFVDQRRRGKPDRPIYARVRVVLGDTVSFKGFHFDAELGGAVTLVDVPRRPPQAVGTLVIEEGHYKAYGQELSVENGEVRFRGPVDNPGLSIRVTRQANDTVLAGIQMGGSLKEPDVKLFSEPPMSQTQILSYIATGGPIGAGGSSGNLVNKALSALGLGGGTQVLSAIGEDIGLESVKLETTSGFHDASLALGRYLSPKLYISYGLGLFDPVSTLRLRYVLSNRFTLQMETGKETSADVLVRTRRK